MPLGLTINYWRKMQDKEKIVVAKPVATRPYSSFRSSELLAGSTNASPSTSVADTMVAIRPKTLRFKPSHSYSPSEFVSSTDDVSESAVCNLSDKALKTSRLDGRSSVVYKPTAKVVSRIAAPLLANLGNDISHQQMIEAQGQVQVPDPEIQNQPTSGLHQNMSPHMVVNQPYEPYMYGSSNSVPLNMGQDMIAQQQTNSGDQSYDGYNWRKYGQKQVKGSEYPRSYYKCTDLNCPVKKKVERSLDGQIAEIVYKGEHNHPKPQPPKRLSSGSLGQTFASDGHGRESGNPVWSDPLIERNMSDSKMDSHNEVGFSGTLYPGKGQYSTDSLVGIPETSGRLSGDCEAGSRAAVVDNDKPKFKRRKNEDVASGAGALTRATAEHHSAVETSIESDVLGDGFRWRKYGQKVVKGNSYPRCYYRCTSLECNVRKYVERASDDPRSFVTTYEGKHNHEMPDSKVNLASSDPDAVAYKGTK